VRATAEMLAAGREKQSSPRVSDVWLAMLKAAPQPLAQDGDKYEHLGDLSAVEPWHRVPMVCDKCMVSWEGCWDNYQCPRCGEGELPWNPDQSADEALEAFDVIERWMGERSTLPAGIVAMPRERAIVRQALRQQSRVPDDPPDPESGLKPCPFCGGEPSGDEALADADAALEAANEIMADLSRRRGLRQELEQVDGDVRREIRNTFALTIRRHIERALKRHGEG